MADNRIATCIRILPEVKRAAQELAWRERLSFSRLLELAVQDRLERAEANNPGAE